MIEKKSSYRAICASDWNECLAPCGPFDLIAYCYPQLSDRLDAVFRQYTANRIRLGEAVAAIQGLLPAPITADQVDAYLKQAFATYHGVAELIEWCLGQNILFMINTTGMIGYFQRIMAKGLLPALPALSAHPLISFPRRRSDPQLILELFETDDKAKNTQAAAAFYHVPLDRIIIIGDSGGDGPHFQWGAEHGALRIGSMTKFSLQAYCSARGIDIHLRFGPSYGPGEARDGRNEMQFNFMDLAPVITDFLK
jgi:phosphoserine phosphatase